MKKGYDIRFKLGHVIIGQSDKVFVRGSKVDNMYHIDFINKIEIYSYVCASAINFYVWHLRLGHINKK